MRDTPSDRDGVLAAWRGVDVRELRGARKVNTRYVGDVMARVLQDIGLDRKRAEAEIVRVWNLLIDPSLTQHAQPAGIRQGTLFVNVDNPVWLSEIVRYRRREILQRLRHSFGPDLIQRISFRIG